MAPRSLTCRFLEICPHKLFPRGSRRLPRIFLKPRMDADTHGQLFARTRAPRQNFRPLPRLPVKNLSVPLFLRFSESKNACEISRPLRYFAHLPSHTRNFTQNHTNLHMMSRRTLTFGSPAVFGAASRAFPRTHARASSRPRIA